MTPRWLSTLEGTESTAVMRLLNFGEVDTFFFKMEKSTPWAKSRAIKGGKRRLTYGNGYFTDRI